MFERYQQYCRKFRRLRFAGCVAFAVAYYPELGRECALLPVSKTLPEISSGQRGWRGGEEEIEKERRGVGRTRDMGRPIAMKLPHRTGGQTGGPPSSATPPV